jgi:hypothetical protein
MKAVSLNISLVVLIIVFVATLLPLRAYATVDIWNTSQFGSIPLFIMPTISAPPCSQHSKESSLCGISWESLLGAIIPSWDGVAKTLARLALTMIKEQTINWIRSGFEGEPLFLQDPEKFFMEMGDQASGVFLEDLGQQMAGDPNYFCKDFLPKFQLDVGGAGRSQYFRRAQCTMSRAVDNVEDYYNDFSNGNWNAFVSMNQRNNNQFGFYMMTLEEQERRREEAENTFKLTSQYGGGYLPTMSCTESNAAGCRKFTIKTPSKAIGDRIGQMVGIDFGDLIAADEVSEVVSAIAQELINYGLREAMNSFL